MPKFVFDNRIGIGTIIALTIATASLIGGYAIYGKTTIENKEILEILVPAVSLNTVHSENTDVHMPYQEKVKEFVPRTEYTKTEKQLEKVSVKQDKIYDLLLDIKGSMPK